MKVEVKNIYRDETPTRKKSLESGSVHVYLPDLKIHIKHIVYFINQDKSIKVYQPSKWCKVENERISVPAVSFEDKSEWKDIYTSVREIVLAEYQEKSSDEDA